MVAANSLIPGASAPNVLLVDDDEALLSAYTRALGNRGFRITTARSGRDALERLASAAFDAVISDVSMPEMGGTELATKLSELGINLPIILMTGDPSIETAARAVEAGAFRYLIKPVDPDTLRDVVLQAIERRTSILPSSARPADGTNLTMALASVWVAYQPVISWEAKAVRGYEALLRSQHVSPLPHALTQAESIIGAAERTGRVHEVGRLIRGRCVQEWADAPLDTSLFVNLHPRDLEDASLYDESSPLCSIASAVVLELTERASLDSVPAVRSRIDRLRELGFRIAVDDLGAGYAGLTSFAHLEPDIVKLDMSLIRGIDLSVTRQKIVRSFVSLAKDMGVALIAEGVETPSERDTLIELGCDLLQGYLFARPQAGFVAWNR